MTGNIAGFVDAPIGVLCRFGWKISSYSRPDFWGWLHAQVLLWCHCLDGANQATDITREQLDEILGAGHSQPVITTRKAYNGRRRSGAEKSEETESETGDD